jgi:predicted 3-demethylubiquinone-9 3-methyltransferase (glyoxalase superfamily)
MIEFTISYLLEKAGGDWRILAYISRSDQNAELAKGRVVIDETSRKGWLLLLRLQTHPPCGRVTPRRRSTILKHKNTICLWFDKNDAHEAARFYAATFPNSDVTAVRKAPADFPGGKKGDVLTVEFTVLGIPCIGLNGGPEFKHSEAFSFQIATDNQEETDRYWNAIVGNGGKESQCGWCKDRWGLSWQITPRALTDAMAAGGDEARRAFAAMMPMKKIDIATIEAARRG